ncbi:hypothetical protein POTOM_030947 [Populus tomentosa]|uniref:OTU domain-containing protein n=1 Tax=Populus tomentosa TaxID=118781 RepID=A0A8X8CR80_POPTO|nr:hypothetical protein POTOM_030947 [Populus tomentosa]
MIVENDAAIARALQEELSRIAAAEGSGVSNTEQELIITQHWPGMIVGNDAVIPHVPKTNGEIPSEDEQEIKNWLEVDYKMPYGIPPIRKLWVLRSRLKVYYLVENKVQGDGNCQFRSLSDQLYDSPEHHKYVREQVIEQLKSQPQMYSSYVPMAYDAYLEKMSRSGEWGDHVTLQAAADLVWANTLLCRFPLLLSAFLSVDLHYGIKIFMITSFKDTCCVEILPKVLKSKNKVIYLSFWAEVHYNPVRRMS